MKRITVLLPVTLLSACSWFGSDEPIEQPSTRLAQLSLPTEAVMPAAVAPAVEQRTLSDIVNQYQSALEVAQDPEVRRQIERRLAGLEMLQSEQRQVDATDASNLGTHYRDAVVLYQDLLQRYPDRADNDRLLYQVAKAYELDGQLAKSMVELNRLVAEYPNSVYLAEAQFRRGEILFSQRQYADAQAAYQAVVNAGDDSSYYLNALYMQGWSQFKRNRYRQSLRPFTEVLDRLLPDTGEMDGLPRAKQQMASDVLRVMSLTFSYLEGPQTIASAYQQLGERSYLHLLYQQLGDLYLSKERYRDSADTYKLFVEQYPQHDQAPQFSVKMIDVYGKGNFPSLILPAKQSFVKNYGIHSDFWAAKSNAVRAELKPHLHTYLTELAKHFHAAAQDKKKARQQALAKKQKTTITDQQIEQQFLQAADWYGEFIASFPSDSATPQMQFLMAESLFEAKAYPRAIDAYEVVAYSNPNNSGYNPEKAAEAGYSAILAYDHQLAALTDSSDEYNQWRERKIASSRLFATTYPNDKRAMPVLAKAAEELFAMADYSQAIEVAQEITVAESGATKSLLRTAWLVQGHSHFELQNYVDAETAYQSALALMASKSDITARQQTLERLAATVFKRSEQLLVANTEADTLQAVDELLRIQTILPDSETAIKAQYDAAAHLMALQAWQQAEPLLVQFRKRYPKHELSATIPAKLAQVYQATDNWQQAGDALALMWKQDSDPEVQRQSLYLAAEMYEKAQNWPAAISHYRDYAHGYPQPFDLVTEARFKMSELYLTTKKTDKRRFWLNKMIDGHRQAGGSGTDRSRYLAAFSATELAAENYQLFKAVPLKLPLKKSLKKKRRAMDKALKAFENVLAYEVKEFSTRASFHIGQIYAQLSADLMASQRPKLSALELEQYELLLEEQAYPFEEQAIAIHETNAQRSWQGVYDEWVGRSFASLAKLQPGRYQKQEQRLQVSRDVY